MKKLMILALTCGLVCATTDRAAAQSPSGKVWAGSCTPKVGDDVELAIHTPQNNDPSTGQKSGVKYALVTVIQGGERSGTSIKGGKRTTSSFDIDQREGAEWAKKFGGAAGAKLGMAKITNVDGSLTLQKGDDVTSNVLGSGSASFTVTRKGKVIGKFTIKKG